MKKYSAELVDRDYADFEFEEEDFKENVIPIRGSMRMGLGLCYSTKEWERERKKVLKKH